MARKNPTMSKATPNDQPVEGMERLPIAVGVNIKAVEQAEVMPEVNMSPNDGDNPTIADAPFANGKDTRRFEATARANPTPTTYRSTSRPRGIRRLCSPPTTRAGP